MEYAGIFLSMCTMILKFLASKFLIWKWLKSLIFFIQSLRYPVQSIFLNKNQIRTFGAFEYKLIWCVCLIFNDKCAQKCLSLKRSLSWSFYWKLTKGCELMDVLPGRVGSFLVTAPRLKSRSLAHGMITSLYKMYRCK